MTAPDAVVAVAQPLLYLLTNKDSRGKANRVNAGSGCVMLVLLTPLVVGQKTQLAKPDYGVPGEIGISLLPLQVFL